MSGEVEQPVTTSGQDSSTKEEDATLRVMRYHDRDRQGGTQQPALHRALQYLLFSELACVRAAAKLEEGHQEGGEGKRPETPDAHVSKRS